MLVEARKAGSNPPLLRTDQKTVTTATKAAQKADAAATSQAAPPPSPKSATSKPGINVTA